MENHTLSNHGVQMDDDAKPSSVHNVYYVSLSPTIRTVQQPQDQSKWESHFSSEYKIYPEDENTPCIKNRDDEELSHTDVGFFMSGSSSSNDVEDFCSSGPQVLSNFVESADVDRSKQLQDPQKPTAWLEDIDFDDSAIPSRPKLPKLQTSYAPRFFEELDKRVSRKPIFTTFQS